MVISQTPLRISLCGGGTDFKNYYEQNEGFVVSAAIDKYVFVIVKERFDELVYVDYSKKEIVSSSDEIQHDLVREAARKVGLQKGFEVSMLADIPSEGSGLGSSSSIIVGLLNAFYTFKGKQITAGQLAREACEIEIDILHKPIGKQDQYIAAYGGLTSFRFKKDDSVEVIPVEMDNGSTRKLGSNLLLFFTNVTRQSTSILMEQNARIGENIEFHNKIKNLAIDAFNYLKQGKIDKIGGILKENWELKKKLSSNITNSDIEEMHKTAMENGSIGAKISGAGGGGFLLCYCKRNDQERLREAFAKYREMPFLLEQHGSKIIFNYIRYNWK